MQYKLLGKSKATLLDIMYLGEYHYNEVEKEILGGEYKPNVEAYYNLLDSGALTGVVAMLNDEVQGYVLFVKCPSLYTDKVINQTIVAYVKPQFRNTGVLKTMLDYYSQFDDSDVTLISLKGVGSISGYKLCESTYVRESNVE